MLGFGVFAIALVIGTPSAGAAHFPEKPSTGNACTAILNNPGTSPDGKSDRRSAVASEITIDLLIDASFGGP